MMEYVEMPSGVILPDHIAQTELQRHRRPKAVDLFCGAGGFSLGLLQAGFEVVCGVDNDVKSTVTYMTNLGAYPCQFHFVEPEDERRLEHHLERITGRGLTTFSPTGSGWISHEHGTPGVSHFILGDVRELTGKQILDWIGMDIEELDLVCGGPPCQGYSRSGKRNVMDPRNSLIFEFARMIVELRPKTMVMEKVPGVLSMVTPQGEPVVEAVCDILEAGHYGKREALLKALEIQQGTACLHRQGTVKKLRQPQLSLFEES